MFRIGDRLVDAFHIAAVEDNDRGTGEDEPADAVACAGGNDVFGAGNIGGEVIAILAPDSGLGRDMEDNVTPSDGSSHGGAIRDVAANLFDVQFAQMGMVAAAERPHHVA